jgi:hypothetical protein
MRSSNYALLGTHYEVRTPRYALPGMQYQVHTLTFELPTTVGSMMVIPICITYAAPVFLILSLVDIQLLPG